MIERLIDYLKGTELAQKNYKGASTVTGGGFYIVIGSILVWIIYDIYGFGNTVTIQQLVFLCSIISAVGFIDDLAGSKEYQGFVGHFKSLIKGQLTTGFFKALISLMAVLLVVRLEEGNIFHKFISLLLLLLMTNLINLFDLRPGRAIKFFLLLAIPLCMGNFFIYLLPVFLFLTSYLSLELKEKVMLGDTGSNTLGIILGLGYLKNLSFYQELLLVFFLIILNLAAERVSFSEIIVNNRFLSWLDQLGRE